MKYRMIAVDLDHTLLDQDSRISARNRDVIRRAVDSGIKFVIATGRMFKTSVTYLDDLGFETDSPIINYHGALVKKSKSGEVMLHMPVRPQIAAAVAGEAENLGFHVSLFIDDQLYISEENDYSRYYQSIAHIGLQTVGNLNNYIQANRVSPTKISIISFDGSLDHLEEHLRSTYGQQLSILQSRPHFLEITDKGATKGQTLAWLAGLEKISAEEIIAFGDGPNDIDMLEYAGLGVAMANGRPEVKKAADLIAPANTEDGVAAVLEEYLFHND